MNLKPITKAVKSIKLKNSFQEDLYLLIDEVRKHESTRKFLISFHDYYDEQLKFTCFPSGQAETYSSIYFKVELHNLKVLYCTSMGDASIVQVQLIGELLANFLGCTKFELSEEKDQAEA